MKNLLDLFSNEIPSVVIDYAKVILPSLIAYFIAKYGVVHPRKLDIKEKQLTCFYLPLYRLTQQYIPADEPLDRDNLAIYLRKVERLIHKNYLYVYPKTLRLFNELKVEASKPQMNMYFVSNFSYQVATDYNILKKNLMYPSDSLFTSIRHLNRLDKLWFFATACLWTLFFYDAATVFLSILNGNFSQVPLNLFATLAFAFVLYLFSFLKKH